MKTLNLTDAQAEELKDAIELLQLDPDTQSELLVSILEQLQDPEACPGCGKAPGEGLSSSCNHPHGCGYWRKEAEHAYDCLTK